MGLHIILIANLSQSASSPSFSAGSSLLAAISSFMGIFILRLPLVNVFSLMAVNSVFWIAGPAFHISSRNTISADGRYPSITRSYTSSVFRRLILTGPKISSGVENLDMRYSKHEAPTKASFNLRATIDFAIPGGPNKAMFSPAIAASRPSLISNSFSYRL